MALFADKDRLIRHSALLIAASQVGNLANILFQSLVGRALSPTEYGALSSMLGATIIVSMPMESIRTALAHFAAVLRAKGRAADAGPMTRRWFIRIGIVAAILAIGLIAAARPLTAFLSLGSRGPVIITGIIMGGMLLAPIYQGALQGLQSFIWMSVAQHSFAVARLMFAAALLALLPTEMIHASSALLAHALAVGLSLLLGRLGLRFALGGSRASGAVSSGFHLYAMRSFIVLACFAFLMNADVLIVKRFFDGHTAGMFARAGTLGRIAVFLPMPIAAALFPKVAGCSAEKSSIPALLKALAGAFILLAAAAGACSIWPRLPLGIVYGDWQPSADMLLWFRGLLWALTPLGLVYVLVNFEMAQKRFGACYALGLCCLAYALGVLRWRETPCQIIAALAVVGVAALLWMLAAVFWQERQNRRSNQPRT